MQLRNSVKRTQSLQVASSEHGVTLTQLKLIVLATTGIRKFFCFEEPVVYLPSPVEQCHEF